MSRHTCNTCLVLWLILAVLVQQGDGYGQVGPSGEGQRKRGPGGRENGGIRMPTPAFQTEVPAHPVDLILGRPTRDSVQLSVLAYEDMEAYVALGSQPSRYSRDTPTRTLRKGIPFSVRLDGLSPNTRYYYQFRWKMGGLGTFSNGVEHSFITARPAGTPFAFTVQADSHLDYGTDPEIYKKSLANVLSSKPDFHIDLGDTFMTDKYTDFTMAAPHYLAQRYHFGLVGGDVPLFLVLGNHDGEQPSRGGSGPGSMVAWSHSMRTKYFPNPAPDAFYTGNKARTPEGAALEDYYAWEWGDALFVVLDPFWYSAPQRGRNGNNWGRSLGREQYDWLQSTLSNRKARYAFVFLHHLVGGETPEGRGGAEASQFFEWGGNDLDGQKTFAERRPGWPAPIHDLLVRQGVNIVFHGHDHLYAQQERDGVIYQLVPQPSHTRVDNTRSAAEYGYRSGTIQGASGILRVTVSPESAEVAYVRAYADSGESATRKTGMITHQYTIAPKARVERGGK